MPHTSVYVERKRKPAQTLDEALARLGKTVRRRTIDTRYPAKGTPETREVGLRIQGLTKNE